MSPMSLYGDGLAALGPSTRDVFASFDRGRILNGT
jgi:hypothetical protein